MLLDKNQMLDIIISEVESVDGDILENVSISFGTVFDPLLSTPNRIRALAGSYLLDVSDDIILYLIHSYSMEAFNSAICDTTKWPKWTYYASLWVAYKVAMNAVMNSQQYVTETGQKTYKKLGDFSVSKDMTSDVPAKKLLEKLDCELLKFGVAVKFCREPLIDCVKGVSANDLRNTSAAQLVKKGDKQPHPVVGRTFRQVGRYPGFTKILQEYDRLVFSNFVPPFPINYQEYSQGYYATQYQQY